MTMTIQELEAKIPDMTATEVVELIKLSISELDYIKAKLRLLIDSLSTENGDFR